MVAVLVVVVVMVIVVLFVLVVVIVVGAVLSGTTLSMYVSLELALMRMDFYAQICLNSLPTPNSIPPNSITLFAQSSSANGTQGTHWRATQIIHAQIPPPPLHTHRG